MKNLSFTLIFGLCLLWTACHEEPAECHYEMQLRLINNTESEVKVFATDYTGEILWLVASPHDTAYSDSHFAYRFVRYNVAPCGLVVADSVIELSDKFYSLRILRIEEDTPACACLYTIEADDDWIRSIWSECCGDSRPEDGE